MSKAVEIGDHKSTVVSSLAGDADTIREKRVVSSRFPINRSVPHNLRSPIATRGNVRHVVDFHHGSTIRLDVGEVCGVFFGFVDHVSVSWIRLGKEIPSAITGNRSVKTIGGKSVQAYSKNVWPWYLSCSLYVVVLATL